VHERVEVLVPLLGNYDDDLSHGSRDREGAEITPSPSPALSPGSGAPRNESTRSSAFSLARRSSIESASNPTPDSSPSSESSASRSASSTQPPSSETRLLAIRYARASASVRDAQPRSTGTSHAPSRSEE